MLGVAVRGIISSITFNSTFILKIADASNQIAYCRIILQEKIWISLCEEELSIFMDAFTIITSSLLASGGDFSTALSKNHAFNQTSVRKGEEICLSKVVAFSIVASWPFTSEGDFIVVPTKPHLFKSDARTSI